MIRGSLLSLIIALSIVAGVVLLGPRVHAGQTAIDPERNVGTLTYGGLRDRLTFVILFFGSYSEDDGSSSSRLGGGSLRWGGRLGRKGDPSLTYEADSDKAYINGLRYSYDNGRVFAVLGKGGPVTQLDWDIRDEDMKAELEQISGRPEIADLLAAAEESKGQ